MSRLIDALNKELGQGADEKVFRLHPELHGLSAESLARISAVVAEAA
jgi:hypothetical protein